MIRRATEKDIKDLIRLLEQVDLVHHLVRPDIFKIGTKYDKYELSLLIRDNSRPIFIYDDNGVMKPGKKGISLSLENWKKLKGFLDDIDESIDNLK